VPELQHVSAFKGPYSKGHANYGERRTEILVYTQNTMMQI